MMRRRMTWVGSGALVLLAASLALPTRSDGVTPAQGAAMSGPQAEQLGPPHASAEQLEAQRRRTRETEWSRDPFAHSSAAASAPGSAPSDAPGRRLAGISRVGSTWMALIDGQIVRADEVLTSGERVVEITRAAVTLRAADRDVTLRL